MLILSFYLIRQFETTWCNTFLRKNFYFFFFILQSIDKPNRIPNKCRNARRYKRRQGSWKPIFRIGSSDGKDSKANCRNDFQGNRNHALCRVVQDVELAKYNRSDDSRRHKDKNNNQQIFSSTISWYPPLSVYPDCYSRIILSFCIGISPISTCLPLCYLLVQ